MPTGILGPAARVRALVVGEGVTRALAAAAVAALAGALWGAGLPDPPTLSESDVGRPAPRDLRATRDFSFELPGESDPGHAGQEPRPVYDHHASLVEQVLGRTERAFAAMQAEAAVAGGTAAPSGDAPARGATAPAPADPGLRDAEQRPRFEALLGVAVSPETFAALRQEGFSDEVRSALAALVGKAHEDMIVADRAPLRRAPRGLVVRGLAAGGEEPREEVRQDVELRGIAGLRDAHHAILSEVEVRYARRPRALRGALAALARALVQPDLIYNHDETLARARRGGTARTLAFKQGQVIVREGDLVSPDHVAIVRAMQGKQPRGSRVAAGVAMALFSALLLGTLAALSSERAMRGRLRARDVLALASILAGVAAGSWLAGAIGRRFEGEVGRMHAYLVPIATAPMLARLLAGRRAAVLVAIGAALIGGLLLRADLAATAAHLVAGLAGAAAVEVVQSRRSILRAGALAGLAGAAAAVFLAASGGAMEAGAVARAAAFATVAGLGSALLCTGLLALYEWAFGYTTDITLLELANLNHPLLRELVLAAPGTYHHSMVVGSLAETACEEIGANGLLARVAAYFHDMGKTRAAGYFAENFKEGDRPHDRLKATMSAMVIRSHVKDTVEILRGHRIPPLVIETATQHHGTSLIEYFYDKAQRQEEGEPAGEREFRYAGVKPQSREAGVLMLADSAEAAARSLADPDEDRLTAVVQRVINKKFTDGQLDECDLTLRDLHAIARAFLRVLRGIYHQRPEYPWQREEAGRRITETGRLRLGDAQRAADAAARPRRPSGESAAAEAARARRAGGEGTPAGSAAEGAPAADGGAAPAARPPDGEVAAATVEHSAEGRAGLRRLGLS